MPTFHSADNQQFNTVANPDGKELNFEIFDLTRQQSYDLLLANLSLIKEILLPSICQTLLSDQNFRLIVEQAMGPGYENTINQQLENYDQDALREFTETERVLHSYLDYALIKGKLKNNKSKLYLLQALAYIKNIRLDFFSLQKNNIIEIDESLASTLRPEREHLVRYLYSDNTPLEILNLKKYPSRINKNYSVTEKTWVISLVNTQSLSGASSSSGMVNLTGHSAILIEGIKDNKKFILHADAISRDGKFIEIRALTNYHRNTDDFSGYSFYTQSDLAQCMAVNITTDRDRIEDSDNPLKIPYQMVSIFNSKHNVSNCIKWAKDKLKVAGIYIKGKDKPATAGLKASTIPVQGTSLYAGFDTDKSNVVTVRFWAGEEVGHISVQTYTGGEDGNGIYASFWPGYDLSENEYCTRCSGEEHQSTHWHTLEDDKLAENREADFQVDLTLLDVSKINQEYLKMKGNLRLWSKTAHFATTELTTASHCSGVSGRLLLIGGINHLFIQPIEKEDFAGFRAFNWHYGRLASYQYSGANTKIEAVLGTSCVMFCSNFKPIDVFRFSLKYYKALLYYVYQAHKPEILTDNGIHKRDPNFTFEDSTFGRSLKNICESFKHIRDSMPTPTTSPLNPLSYVFFNHSEHVSYAQAIVDRQGEEPPVEEEDLPGSSMLNDDDMTWWQRVKQEEERSFPVIYSGILKLFAPRILNEASDPKLDKVIIWDFSSLNNPILLRHMINTLWSRIENTSLPFSFEETQTFCQDYLKTSVYSYVTFQETIKFLNTVDLQTITKKSSVVVENPKYFIIDKLILSLQDTAKFHTYSNNNKYKTICEKIQRSISNPDINQSPIRLLCLADAILHSLAHDSKVECEFIKNMEKHGAFTVTAKSAFFSTNLTSYLLRATIMDQVGDDIVYLSKSNKESSFFRGDRGNILQYDEKDLDMDWFDYQANVESKGKYSSSKTRCTLL